jgi:excisionase family DNA binding protein
MSRPRTPGEVARWRHELSTLAPERQDAVIRMLAEALADCLRCEEPIRRCDPRHLVDSRLHHLHCAGGGDVSAKLLRVEDVAEILDMRVDRVYRLVREDAIPHIRFGRSVKFRAESIEEWLGELERGNGRR